MYVRMYVSMYQRVCMYVYIYVQGEDVVKEQFNAGEVIRLVGEIQT